MFPPSPPPPGPGSKDSPGASDHDQPYRWGRLPSVDTTSLFTPWQLMRLMFLRGAVQNRIIDRHLAPPDPDGLA